MESGTYVIKVYGPITLEPIYDVYYLVTVILPNGEIREWVKEGEEYSIKAPRTIQVSDDVKLVFHKWVGDIDASVPEYTFEVNKPMVIVGVYERYYRVSIDSPLGKDYRWVPEGNPLIIYEPPELPGVLTIRVLSYYIS